jgi:single-strand DNA-binding protein
MNQGTFIGNLGKQPEMRYLGDGTPVTNFSIGVRCYNGDTLWVKVSAFRRRAETCNEFLKKGSKVMVQGADQEGNARASLEVTANNVEFLSPKDDNQQAPQAEQQQGGGETLPF